MSSGNKNDCPTPGCSQQKTSWSDKCASCEHQRKRLTIAIERKDADRAFLSTYGGFSLAQIASERHISRERARQLLSKAKSRLNFLSQYDITASVDMTPRHLA